MLAIFALVLVVCEISSLSEVPRPRGVPLSRGPLYNPTKDFQCFDNSLTIPFALVNDDYCDCPDASDEPGTAACPNGVFYCTNDGYKPLNISSSRVNDGICDCCDGSDEYVNGKCINNCRELGRSAREEALKRAELLKIGKELRSKLSEAGMKLKQEKKEKLLELQNQLSEAEKVVSEKEHIKKELEELENAALAEYRKIEEENKRIKAEAEAASNRVDAINTFTKFDSNQDEMIDLGEIKTRQTFDKDRNGEVSEEEARYFLNERDAVNLEEFIDEVWPRMKPFIMMDAGIFKPPGEPQGEGEVEEVALERDENEQDPDEAHEEENLENEDEEEEDEETGEHTHEDEQDTNTTVQYDEETQKLIDSATEARNHHSEAERSLRAIQSEITAIEDYLKKDFGEDEAFAALEGKCFDFEDREYIYKLCPFEKATQQAKSDSSGTIDMRLGAWARWTGPSNNIYASMLYDKGQSCWNGPQRSTSVNVNCGSESKLLAVSEPNRCEYLFEFQTPAACVDATHDEHADDVHDEL